MYFGRFDNLRAAAAEGRDKGVWGMCGKREGSAVEIFIGLRDLSSEINCALTQSVAFEFIVVGADAPMAGVQINHRSRRNIARLSFVRYTCALLSRFVRGPRAHFRRMYLCANGGGALKYDPV